MDVGGREGGRESGGMIDGKDKHGEEKGSFNPRQLNPLHAMAANFFVDVCLVVLLSEQEVFARFLGWLICCHLLLTPPGRECPYAHCSLHG